YSSGERGRNRVRVAEDAGRSRRLFVEFRENGRKVRRYLTHRDRERAKAQAEQMAAEFRAQEAQPRARTTLQTLFEIYDREVTPSKAPGTQKHDRAAAALFLRPGGKDGNPKTSRLPDCRNFIK